MTKTNRDVAMLEVLQILGRRWRHKFAPGEVPGLLPMWRDKCAHVPVSALLEMAQDVIVNWPDGPPPSHVTFAADAMKLARSRDPELALQPSYEGPMPVVVDPDKKRAGALILDLKQRLGSWPDAMRVWEKLLSEHPAQRDAFEKGHVPPYIIDEAVEAWLATPRSRLLPKQDESEAPKREWRSSERLPTVMQ